MYGTHLVHNHPLSSSENIRSRCAEKHMGLHSLRHQEPGKSWIPSNLRNPADTHKLDAWCTSCPLAPPKSSEIASPKKTCARAFLPALAQIPGARTQPWSDTPIKESKRTSRALSTQPPASPTSQL